MHKLFICSTNLSGKGFLLQLLENHSQIKSFPYHKFGFSHLADFFFETLNIKHYPVIKGYFNTNDDYVLSIINQNDDKTYKISFGELLSFVFKYMDSIPYLLQSHFSKQVVTYVSDELKYTSDYDYNFHIFIDTFSNNLKNYKNKSFTIEELDNNLYSAFEKSVSNFSLKSENSNFLIMGSNGSDQIHNLYKYYTNSKILFVKRDPISISYANSKRILSKSYAIPNNDLIYKLMINSTTNFKTKINDVLSTAENYSVKYDNIKIISFENLIYNTSVTVKEISNFLNRKSISSNTPSLKKICITRFIFLHSR